MSIPNSQGNRKNLKLIQAISVNIDRLDNKQMNFQIWPDRRQIGANLIFQGYQFTKNGKTKNIYISARIVQLDTFSVNIDLDFVRGI